MSDEDWRLNGQERYLLGVRLSRRAYRRSQTTPTWEHDHCEFCWAKFMVEDVPDVLHEGYCTDDEYRWVCDACVEAFKERFRWTLEVEQGEPPPFHDRDFRVDTGRAADGGTFIRVVHLPSGAERTRARLGADRPEVVTAQLRAELEAALRGGAAGRRHGPAET